MSHCNWPGVQIIHGKMAERSKACDSSESLPASAGFSSGYPGVGSNPTLVNFLVSQIQKAHFWKRINLQKYTNGWRSRVLSAQHALRLLGTMLLLDYSFDQALQDY